jgi:hypothetical protein
MQFDVADSAPIQRSVFSYKGKEINMALILDNLDTKRKFYEVIAFQDSSVQCTREEYTQIYLESFADEDTPNEEILRLDSEPRKHQKS